jgi:hypothetical protein
MTHYAKVNQGIVVSVIVAEADFFTNGHFVDTSPGTWIQTSYNTKGGVHYNPETNQPDGGVALRGNYAGVGFIYDSKNDVFYHPQPYPSWTISAPNWTWTAPTPMPETGGPYVWNETTKTWVTQS